MISLISIHFGLGPLLDSFTKVFSFWDSYAKEFPLELLLPDWDSYLKGFSIRNPIYMGLYWDSFLKGFSIGAPIKGFTNGNPYNVLLMGLFWDGSEVDYGCHFWDGGHVLQLTDCQPDDF